MLQRRKPPAEQPQDRTLAQKAANWWHYHWQYLLAGAAVVTVAGFMIKDVVSRPVPDYTLAVVGKSYLPEELRTQLTQQLEAMGTDVNGDGKVLVDVAFYQIDLAQQMEQGQDQQLTAAPSSNSQNAEFDPMQSQLEMASQMAATVGLTADMQEGISTLFLLEDPRTFAETCGSLAGEGQTRQQAWSDCPALAAMDFSQYDAQAGQSLSGQQVMSRYTLACREDFKQLTPQHQAGIALFDQLTGQAG